MTSLDLAENPRITIPTLTRNAEQDERDGGNVITKVKISKEDIEDAIDHAVEEFNQLHNKVPKYLVLGRLAYEELRDMSIIGHRNDPGNHIMTHYKTLEITVVEEPSDMLAIGCKPD